MRIEKNIMVENAEVAFKNFTGLEGDYNKKGDKNFCVIFDQETGNQLKEDGWNIKYLKPREEGDEPRPYLQVSMGWEVKPPRILMIGDTSGARTELKEDTCSVLDDLEWITADLVINPYNWEVNGNTGVKAYLRSLYVTVVEDYLSAKYAVTNAEG